MRVAIVIMSDIIDTSVSPKSPNDNCENHLPLSTTAIAENINEANETNVECTEITEGKIISAIF